MSSRTYVAFDFETTGIYASTNRVLEIGLVKFDQNFQIIAEYETLINPHRDVGPVEIHGVTPSLLVNAPEFSEVAHDICEFMNGSVLIAHNKNFDLGFLRRELELTQIQVPPLDALCTMELIRSAYPSSPRKLADCCEFLGIEVDHAHEALSDARMAAQIAIHILEKYGYPAIPDPAQFVIESSSLSSKRALRRLDSEVSILTSKGYLGTLIDRLPVGTPLTDRHAVSAAEYLNLLDRMLEDRLLESTEADELHAIAVALELSGDHVRLLHSSYLVNLCNIAMADGELSTNEKLDIQLVSEILGVSSWQDLLETAERNLGGGGTGSRALQSGLRVCFTGTMERSRPECESIAKSKGLVVLPRVSQDLDILVVSDPHSESTKARKARSYGTRIMTESAFFNMVMPLPVTNTKTVNGIEKNASFKALKHHLQNDDDEFELELEQEEEEERREFANLLSGLPERLLNDDGLESELQKLELLVSDCVNESKTLEILTWELREILYTLWAHLQAIKSKTSGVTPRISATIEVLEDAILDQMSNAKSVLADHIVELGHSWIGSLIEIFADYWRKEKSDLARRPFEIRESNEDFENPSTASRLAGLSIVVTGDFKEFDRVEVNEAIKNRGGLAPSSVSGRTYALVAGNLPGEVKIAAATSRGVPIIDYEGLLYLLENGFIPGVVPREPASRKERAKSPPSIKQAAIETIECQSCGDSFERLQSRGRKPHKCPTCR
jgi:DNA polymerase-3 subunit epsilon